MTTGAPQYADISGYQPESIDWHAYAAWARQWDGIARVAIKSTEGSTFTDAHFAKYRAGALGAGVEQIFYYHYARPNLNTAASEAAWQRKVVGALREHDRLMLDYEENVSAATAAWALEWLDAQAASYGSNVPVIYASDAYARARLQDKRLAKYLPIIAYWTYSPTARPACPPPWSHYLALQYSDKATIPGIGTNVDCNVYLGGPFMLDIAEVSNHFTSNSDGSVWTCIQTKQTLGHGMLEHYCTVGNAPYYGLTLYGLPRTGEIAVPGAARGVVLQICERGVLCYDPGHTIDDPPGSGDVYALHLDKVKSPAVAALLILLGFSASPAPAPSVNLADAAAQAKTIAAAAASLAKDLGV